jgi:hypothetical protein
VAYEASAVCYLQQSSDMAAQPSSANKSTKDAKSDLSVSNNEFNDYTTAQTSHSAGGHETRNGRPRRARPVS